MKKSIFAAVLGMAACAATSYGQGYLVFTSYIANGAVGATTSIFGTGELVPAGYTASLLYSLSPISDPVDFGSASSISSLPAGGLLSANITAGYATSGASTPGYFDGGNAFIPGYVADSTVYFEVLAYNGSDYASSAMRGRSGIFTMTSLAASTSTAIPTFGDSGTPMPNFFVAPVPEPTTLALAGLGGLASLVAFRRKQA